MGVPYQNPIPNVRVVNFGGACNETKEVVEAIEAHMAVQKDTTPAVVAPPTVTLVDNTALTNQTIGEPAANTITTTTAQ